MSLTRLESFPVHLALDAGGTLLDVDLIGDGWSDVAGPEQLFERPEANV
jgi:hypothetical protein